MTKIPGIKYDNSTNTSSTTTTLSNTTDLPKFDLDSNNNNNVSTQPCIMHPCRPGEMCIQVFPETELQ